MSELGNIRRLYNAVIVQVQATPTPPDQRHFFVHP